MAREKISLENLKRNRVYTLEARAIRHARLASIDGIRERPSARRAARSPLTRATNLTDKGFRGDGGCGAEEVEKEKERLGSTFDSARKMQIKVRSDPRR